MSSRINRACKKNNFLLKSKGFNLKIMQKLQSRALFLFWIHGFIASFVPIIILVTMLFGSKLEGSDGDEIVPIVIWVIVIGMIVVNIVLFVWSWLNVKMYSYGIKDNELVIQFGVLNKKNINIPFARIQNVNVFESLWARILGLAELQIQTAGSSNIEGRIPGIDKKDAEEIRKGLLNRSGAKHEGI